MSEPRRARARWAALWAVALAAILVPFALWGDRIEAWAAHALSPGTAPGAAAALVVGLLGVDILAPIPSSLVSTAAGALLGLPRGAAASWLGMTVSTWLGYWLGARARAGVGRSWVGEAELARAAEAGARQGIWALGLFRGVPVLAEATVFWAGMSGVPPLPFALVTTVANLAVSVGYAWAGATGAKGGAYVVFIIGALAAPALGMLAGRRADRRA
ncbi:MAG: VTT domain-containing protein [Armatimonadetes bacterium]|nr:VTT domain-containing protein [Armatimonadota bacterium]